MDKQEYTTERNKSIIDLSTQDGYNIASAVRGPDMEGDGHYVPVWLKAFFTARIREVVGADYQLCWIRLHTQWIDHLLYVSIGVETAATVYDIVIRDADKYAHYLSHVLKALTSIKRSEHLVMPDVDILINACECLMHTTYSRSFSTFEDAVNAAKALTKENDNA